MRQVAPPSLIKILLSIIISENILWFEVLFLTRKRLVILALCLLLDEMTWSSCLSLSYITEEIVLLKPTLRTHEEREGFLLNKRNFLYYF